VKYLRFVATMMVGYVADVGDGDGDCDGAIHGGGGGGVDVTSDRDAVCAASKSGTW
jgi:hypothetical protein